MPNGKPGDHMITDITVHQLPVFGPACDDLIREIHQRGGRAHLPEEKLLHLDPRFGGQPDYVALEAELRRIRNALPPLSD